MAATAFTREGQQSAFADDVYRLYHATLGRDPDTVGLAGWAEQLADGADFLSVVAGFVGSSEFQRTYGSLSNDAFVSLLYTNVLGRAADAGGLAAWSGALGRGTLSRADVVEGFAQSGEFVASSAIGLETFMRKASGDRFDGGAGNDVLIGGFGSDTFTFAPGDAGQDTVVGLEAWDTVDLTGFGYANEAAARALMTQTDAGVIFADGGVSILFADTTLAQITDTVLAV